MTDGAYVVDSAGKTSFESPSGEGPIVVRATGAETDGAYDIVEATIRPVPATTPMHVHHDNDEAIYVLEGEVDVALGDEIHSLTAGGYAMALRGVPHTYRNGGEETARVLFVYTPGDHCGYLEEAAELGVVEDESDIERLEPILESYGIEMVGPPLGAE